MECDTHMPFTEMQVSWNFRDFPLFKYYYYKHTLKKCVTRNNKREEQSDEEVITIYIGNDPAYSNT